MNEVKRCLLRFAVKNVSAVARTRMWLRRADVARCFMFFGAHQIADEHEAQAQARRGAPRHRRGGVTGQTMQRAWIGAGDSCRPTTFRAQIESLQTR